MVISEKPTRDLGGLLNALEIQMSTEDLKNVQLLRDFLDKGLALDPAKRLTPEQGLQHPFITPPLVQPSTKPQHN